MNSFVLTLGKFPCDLVHGRSVDVTSLTVFTSCMVFTATTCGNYEERHCGGNGRHSPPELMRGISLVRVLVLDGMALIATMLIHVTDSLTLVICEPCSLAADLVNGVDDIAMLSS